MIYTCPDQHSPTKRRYDRIRKSSLGSREVGNSLMRNTVSIHFPTIYQLITKGNNSFTVEKPGKHHINDTIKISTGVGRTSITCFLIFSKTGNIILLIFLPRRHNLHLIMRKHQGKKMKLRV